MSKLICPNCGSEVALPEHSTLGFGVSLSKEGNDIHYLNLEKTNNNNLKENKSMTRAEERIEILKNSGVDTSNYFAINSDTVIKMVNGVPSVVEDDVITPVNDRVVEEIYANGYVKNSKLHRRFVMAQMFHALDYVSYRGDEKGFDAWLRRKGYNYQWDMLIKRSHADWTGELWTLAQLQKSDTTEFNKRARFFNVDVVRKMLNDYVNKLENYINNDIPTRSCKGVPYKRLPIYGDVFVVDLYKKVYSKMKTQIREITWTSINGVPDYERVAKRLYVFIRDYMIKLPNNTKFSKDFVDAYKGAGSYYTLQNLVKFHNVREAGCDLETTLARVEEKTEEFKNSGCWYVLLGYLKYLIEINGFNYYDRMKELGVIR